MPERKTDRSRFDHFPGKNPANDRLRKGDGVPVLVSAWHGADPAD